jgi:D-alanyl-D-alanine dipeptidase
MQKAAEELVLKHEKWRRKTCLAIHGNESKNTEMPARASALFLLIAVLSACAAQPSQRVQAVMRARSVERAATAGLVDVTAVIPEIDVDLRYQSSDNVSGRAIYPEYMPCLLRQGTAQRLRQAQALLKEQGYALRVWDAWRPPEVQDVLSAATQRSGLFLDPAKGWSRHCGGISVDATLTDLAGKLQRMPSDFDERLGPRSASTYSGEDEDIRRNLKILHTAMRRAGLIPLDEEWWHFDDVDHINSPVPVISGAQIGVIVR